MGYSKICIKCLQKYEFIENERTFLHMVGRDEISGVTHHKYMVCKRCNYRSEVENDYKEVLARALDAYFRSKIDLPDEEIDKFLSAVRKLVRRLSYDDGSSHNFLLWLRGWGWKKGKKVL